MDVHVKGAITTNNNARIYQWLGMDCCSPRDFDNAIKKANGERLDIYINSGGGDVFSASEIANTIMSYKGGAMVHVVGLAASAASIIMCAAPSEIAPNAMVMVHNASSYAEGDTNVMSHEADVLAKVNKAIASAYMRKSGMSEAEALELMNKETWMNADEVVSRRLCDKIAVSSNVQMTASLETVLPKTVIDKISQAMQEEAEAQNKQKLEYAQAQLNLLKLKTGGM